MINPYRAVRDPARAGDATAARAWLPGMRILVTGAAGFIGSHVVEAALAAGHEVRGVGSLPAQGHDGKPGYWPGGAELVTGDVRDPGTVDLALSGVDAVCHQAAIVGLGADLGDM